MKFWSKKNILLVLSLGLLGFGLSQGQGYLSTMSTQMDAKQKQASSKMTYGRFLEYLDMGWIKTLDFYDNGRIAIIEASSPELGDRAQKIRVEIPVGASPLIVKLREAKVDFTSHPSANYEGLFTLLSNIFIPLVVLGGLFFLFRRSTNFMGGPGQAMNFRKARAKVQMDANTGIVFSDVAGI